MSGYLLGSNVLIRYLRGRRDAVELLEALAQRGSLLCSAISVLEVQAGVKRQAEDRTNAFLEGLEVCPMDRDDANQAGAYIREYRRKGITVDFADSIIAATAISRGIPLVTENAAHFPMPGLRLLAPQNGIWPA